MNRRHRPRFTDEAFSTVWRRRNLLVHHLEGDGTLELDVLGAEYKAHAASSQLFDHTIVTEHAQVTRLGGRTKKLV